MGMLQFKRKTGILPTYLKVKGHVLLQPGSLVPFTHAEAFKSVTAMYRLGSSVIL